MKKLLKRIIPGSFYRILSRVYRAWLYHNEVSRLTRMQKQAAVAERDLKQRIINVPPKRILIVPSDPRTLIGSLGDEAVLSTVVAMARLRNSSVEVDIIVDGKMAKATAVQRGLHPVDIWARFDYPAAVVQCLNAQDYDVVVAVGADSVDGGCVPYLSGRIVKAADLAARSGVPATILGFSVSKRMSPAVAELFDGVDPRLQINVRDDISLVRFRSSSEARAELVADSAFLCEPGEVDNDTKTWIEQNRAVGRSVIGMNLHPSLMIGSEDLADTVANMNAIVASGLLQTAERREVAWLLMPHDYRPGIGDGICLRPIMDQIAPALDERAHYLGGVRQANELKAVAGLLDGVVTGRMHLAIGALGMGTPTMSLTYFDKFEGLYRHFGLPEWLLLPPSVFHQDQAFYQRLNRFIDELAQLRAIVKQKLPDVLRKSQRNFAIFSGGKG